MASVTAAHVLEDFVESIEMLPDELRQAINKVKQLAKQFEECRHALYRKRNLLLRNDDKVKLNPDMRVALLRKIERESTRLDDLLLQKMKLEEHVEHLIERGLRRFDEELMKQTEYRVDSIFPPDTDSQIEEALLSNPAIDDTTEALIRISPKKRDGLPADGSDSLQDVPAGEPVYCICRQVAYGQMIACSNRKCVNEWFHADCVNAQHDNGNITKSWTCDECLALSGGSADAMVTNEGGDVEK